MLIKYLYTECDASFNNPKKVLLPVLVKSVFNAGVPEYNNDISSALSVQVFLKLCSKSSGNSAKAESLSEKNNFAYFNILWS